MLLNLCFLIYASSRVNRKWIFSTCSRHIVNFLPFVKRVSKGGSYVASPLPISSNISCLHSMGYGMAWPLPRSVYAFWWIFDLLSFHTRVFQRWGKRRSAHVWFEFNFHGALAAGLTHIAHIAAVLPPGNFTRCFSGGFSGIRRRFEARCPFSFLTPGFCLVVLILIYSLRSVLDKMQWLPKHCPRCSLWTSYTLWGCSVTSVMWVAIPSVVSS